MIMLMIRGWPEEAGAGTGAADNCFCNMMKSFAPLPPTSMALRAAKNTTRNNSACHSTGWCAVIAQYYCMMIAEQGGAHLMLCNNLTHVLRCETLFTGKAHIEALRLTGTLCVLLCVFLKATKHCQLHSAPSPVFLAYVQAPCASCSLEVSTTLAWLPQNVPVVLSWCHSPQHRKALSSLPLPAAAALHCTADPCTSPLLRPQAAQEHIAVWPTVP
jgi:hypothetical protein